MEFLRAIILLAGPLRCEDTVLHLGSRNAPAAARLSDGPETVRARDLIFRP